MIRIRMVEGIEFFVWDLTLKQVRDLVTKAMRKTALVSFENDKGKIRYVNPSQIIYFEEDQDDELTVQDQRTK